MFSKKKKKFDKRHGNKLILHKRNHKQANFSFVYCWFVPRQCRTQCFGLTASSERRQNEIKAKAKPHTHTHIQTSTCQELRILFPGITSIKRH